MIIALVGTPSSGKDTVMEYLISRHDFRRLELSSSAEPALEALDVSEREADRTVFPTADALLDHVTRHWRSHYVTTSLQTWAQVDPFLKRPFFLLVATDGPLRSRYERERRKTPELNLDAFIDAHDALLYTPGPRTPGEKTDVARVLAAAHVAVNNHFGTVEELYNHLDQLDLLDDERLRPGWDLYFMTLATLAAQRSNCMKRRVGAVLVRSKRILSTGYNGTPRGTRNCNEGGCPRCNGPAKGGELLSNCLCLHAEENALLEAGRDRIGTDAVIYCNTCPCLLCSVKIVQCGVREVVYNQSYSMDTASAKVLEEGGVSLRQLNLPGQTLP